MERRRAAAVASLEIADALLAGQYSRSAGPGALASFVRDALDVLEIGCRAVRSEPSSEFERIWMLASIAVSQSVQNIGVTARRPSVTDAARGSPLDSIESAYQDHWQHAAARFPQEPRIALAALVARPEARRMPNRPGTNATFMAQGLGSFDREFVDRNEARARGYIAGTIRDLGTLVDVPGVGAEARLRRGILHFHRAELELSLKDVQQAAVSAGDDPFVGYLGELYTGLVFEALARPADAIDAYRRALEHVPGAKSAVVALSSSLFLAGRRNEAAALMERALAAGMRGDPWIEFSFGDYRFWPRYRAQLRLVVSQ